MFTKQQNLKSVAVSYSLELNRGQGFVKANKIVEDAAVIYGFIIENTEMLYPDGTTNSLDE